MIAALLVGIMSVGSCSSMAGADALVSDPAVKVIWVGEFHGTAEEPALFGDVVCQAMRHRPVVVALERNVSEQAAWDTYMNSNGDRGAAVAFLKHGLWSAPIQDGRNSSAMLKLAQRLRNFRLAGSLRSVKMMVREPQPFTAAGHEAGMVGEVLATEAAYPDALVLAYSGNRHASRATVSYGEETYAKAARLMPRTGLKTTNIESGPGEAWNCQEDGCRVHRYESDDETARGIVPLQNDPDGFDFVAHTGRATTASLPAVKASGASSR